MDYSDWAINDKKLMEKVRQEQQVIAIHLFRLIYTDPLRIWEAN